MDIGANQGLFAIAVRQYFKDAQLACYEPNKELSTWLTHNANTVDAKVYFEAVSSQDGKMELIYGETDLHTIAISNADGPIEGVSLRNVVARAGGFIDILKMDCEGGEWDLLTDREVWKDIGAITMEYHLWAKPEVTVQMLSEQIGSLGFRVLTIALLSDSFGILTAIKVS